VRAEVMLSDLPGRTRSDEEVEPKPKAAAESASVQITNVRKEFRRSGGAVVTAIDDCSLSVGPSEFLVLLGPSGCGKTTLLRTLAGLERPDGGEIAIDGRLVYSSQRGLNLPPEQRPVGMVFQSYALWPHMSVYKNVSYPLESRRADRSTIRERVMKALGAVGVADLAEQHPGRLSGGQQQRVEGA